MEPDWLFNGHIDFYVVSFETEIFVISFPDSSSQNNIVESVPLWRGNPKLFAGKRNFQEIEKKAICVHYRTCSLRHSNGQKTYESLRKKNRLCVMP
jgi:hypothetical protein